VLPELDRSVGLEIANSLIEFGQSALEHLTMPGITGVGELLANSLTGKNQSVDVALSSCLLGRHLSPQGSCFFRSFRLLSLDSLAFPSARHKEIISKSDKPWDELFRDIVLQFVV